MRIEEIGNATLINGDCRTVMAAMEENSVDAIVCDPPYGLSFMGKGWDHGVPGKEFWVEALRVAKPGAHLLAFGGTRTFHRLAVAIEDAGWEIRDTVMWVYGSGFPKSLDVSKAIDKAAGAVREVTGPSPRHGGGVPGAGSSYELPPEAHMLTAPSTDAAKQWQGWGTALKPAWEPIILARKPLVGTVAANVQQFGTGGLNIDGCRIEGVKGTPASPRRAEQGAAYSDLGNDPGTGSGWDANVGRWPANLIHSGEPEVLACFPDSKGQLADVSHTAPSAKTSNVYGAMKREGEASQDSDNEGEVGFKMKPGARRLDSGSAARFFYCAKASKSDRDSGGMKNIHATVKPNSLMKYLCRLVTPSNGTVLDPFMGSGSTGKAALQEGFKFVGIELDKEHGYFDIACARIKADHPELADTLKGGV